MSIGDEEEERKDPWSYWCVPTCSVFIALSCCHSGILVISCHPGRSKAQQQTESWAQQNKKQKIKQQSIGPTKQETSPTNQQRKLGESVQTESC
jgi:hypothetical protein